MMSRWILVLLPLMLPTYVVRFHLGPFPTTLLEIFLIASLVVWSVERGKDGWQNAHRTLHQRGWAWPMLAWLIVGVIAVVVAPNHYAALGLLRAYFLEPLLIFAMLMDVLVCHSERSETEPKNPSPLSLLLRSSILILIILAVWAIFQFTTGIGIPHPWEVWPGRRATGPFPFPNGLSLFVVPLAVWCLSSIVCHSERRPAESKNPSPNPRAILRLRSQSLTSLRMTEESLSNFIFPIIGFLSGVVATILAKSVGGMIALVVATVVIGVMNKKTRTLTLGVAVIGLVLALGITPIRQKLQRQFLFQEWSGKVRMIIWKETRNMLHDHPVFGVGLGSYPAGIKPYHKATWMEIFQYPHNILLNLWSEVGILGIAVFTWILIHWLRQGRTLALPIILAILIHGLVDVPYFKNDLAIAFWLLIAVTTLREFRSEALSKRV